MTNTENQDFQAAPNKVNSEYHHFFAEEQQSVQDCAAKKLREILSDPEVLAVFKRLKDKYAFYTVDN